MITILKTLFGGMISKAGAIFGAVGGAILLLLGAYMRGRKSKADEVQAKTADSIIKTVKKEKEIEKSNNDIGADARRDKLRKYASGPE